MTPSQSRRHLLDESLGHWDAPLSDFYLLGEPGSAFFPMTEEECEDISVYLMPEEKDVSLVASSIVDVSCMTDWLDYDQTQPWDELLPLVTTAN